MQFKEVKCEETKGTCFTGFHYFPTALGRPWLKAGRICTGEPALHAGGQRFKSSTAHIEAKTVVG